MTTANFLSLRSYFWKGIFLIGFHNFSHILKGLNKYQKNKKKTNKKKVEYKKSCSEGLLLQFFMETIKIIHTVRNLLLV